MKLLDKPFNNNFNFQSRPEVIFRVDASTSIGLGHLSRCLVLANHLYNHGLNSSFICQSDPCLSALFSENLFCLFEIEQKPLAPRDSNYKAVSVEQQLEDSNNSADLLRQNNILSPSLVIVDHYGFDIAWERNFLDKLNLGTLPKLIVLDDYANRPHICDVLIDHVLGHTRSDYIALVPPKCIFLGAPKNIILRPEFASSVNKVSRRSGDCIHSHHSFSIFLAMGLDPFLRLFKVIESLSLFDQEYQCISIDLMVSSATPHLDQIKNFVASLGLKMSIHVNLRNPASIMKGSDLAITSGGLISYELAACNVPMLLVPQSPAELKASTYLEHHLHGWVIRDFDEITPKNLAALLYKFIANKIFLEPCKTSLIDGLGANRVASAIISLLSSKNCI